MQYNAFAVESQQDINDREATEFEQYADEKAKALELNYSSMSAQLEPDVFEARSVAAGNAPMAQPMEDRTYTGNDAAEKELRDFRVSRGSEWYAVGADELTQQNQAGRPFMLKDVTGGGDSHFVHPAGVGPLGVLGGFEGAPTVDAQGNPIEIDPTQASFFRGSADNRQYIRKEAPISGAQGLYTWDKQPTAEEIYDPRSPQMAALRSGIDRYMPEGFTRENPNREEIVVFDNGNYAYRDQNGQYHMVDQAQPGLSSKVGTPFADEVPGMSAGIYYRPAASPGMPWEQYSTNVPASPPPKPPPPPAEPEQLTVDPNGTVYYRDPKGEWWAYNAKYPDDPSMNYPQAAQFADAAARLGPGTYNWQNLGPQGGDWIPAAATAQRPAVRAEDGSTVPADFYDKTDTQPVQRTTPEREMQEMYVENDGSVSMQDANGELVIYNADDPVAIKIVAARPPGRYFWDAAEQNWMPR